MLVKSVFKKKIKIKNPITLKTKNKKIKHDNSVSSIDTYLKFDTDNIKNKHILHENIQISSNIEVNNDDVPKESKVKKKRKSTDNNPSNESKTLFKKKVTFAADVKDNQKCTAGNLKLLSLNKRKKINYLKKLKAKKNKQKNAKKCEENATAINTPRQERAIEYLMQWKNNRSNWKFKKIFQLWLLKNTYDNIKASILYKKFFTSNNYFVYTLNVSITIYVIFFQISQENFDILVEYLQTIEGKSRSLLLQNANAIVAESSVSNEQEQLSSLQKNKYLRARTIIQLFD